MSYGLYIGKNLTSDGHAWLAGYGDEPSSHWLEIIPRKNFYSNPKKLKDDFEILDKLALKDNTLFGWVKSFFFRNKDH